MGEAAEIVRLAPAQATPGPGAAIADGDLAGLVRAVHKCFPRGVAVVTTRPAEKPHALAVNAVSSISLEPPSVLVCIKTTARTHEHLDRGEHLGINFLAHDQRLIAERCSVSGGAKFEGLAWAPGPESKAPILDRVSAHFEVLIRERFGAGTHTVFLGEVLDPCAPARPPLIYVRGRFFDGQRLAPAAMAAFVGKVVEGDSRGLGLPTANVELADSHQVEFGVYAARRDGRAAAFSVGVRPTFADHHRPLIEASYSTSTPISMGGPSRSSSSLACAMRSRSVMRETSSHRCGATSRTSGRY